MIAPVLHALISPDNRAYACNSATVSRHAHPASASISDEYCGDPEVGFAGKIALMGRMHRLARRPACQEMQPAAALSCGLPIAQPGRPFYFVEVSELPSARGAGRHISTHDALAARNMYSRLPQVRRRPLRRHACLLCRRLFMGIDQQGPVACLLKVCVCRRALLSIPLD